MTPDVQSLQAALKEPWCDSLTVTPLPDGRISISTPFLYGDGDAYPIILRREREGWLVTDDGLALGHLQFDELDLTEARLGQVGRLAEAHGCTLQGRNLMLRLPTLPSAEDLADFIELLAQVSGLPLQVAEREGDQFRSRARERVLGGLVQREQALANWKPNREKGDLFRADLWMPTPIAPVVAFFAGSTQKAERSMLSIVQYQRWSLDVRSVIAHNGALGSDTIYRAQVTLGDDDAIVAVREDATTTGYVPLMRKLRDLGVEVVPAAL